MELEQKLALIQQIRQKENHNYQRLGEGSYEYRKGDLYGDTWTGEQVSLFSSSFRLRFLLAVFLFLCFFYLEIRDISLGNLNGGEIQSYISENLSLSSLDSLIPMDDIH
ncbi:MAG: hypothetical protein ACI4DN_05350 [Lachnospiraceae bacterium]